MIFPQEWTNLEMWDWKQSQANIEFPQQKIKNEPKEEVPFWERNKKKKYRRTQEDILVEIWIC